MNASARPSNKAVRNGLAHLNAGRIDDAERLFRSVLKSEPDNPDANHAFGTLAVRQGNLPLALRFLTAALQANPQEARHWLSFAEALLQSGSIGDARAVIEKAAARFSGPEIAALRLRVDHSELYLRAVEHHRAGRLAEAEPLYAAILAADPGHADSLHMIGQLAAQTGRAELGIPLIEQAIRLKGDVAAFYCSLGNALAARGRTEQAIQAFTRALELKPDFPEAQTDLGHLYRSLGYLDEAIKPFKTAIASGANTANAHNNLGALLFNIGKFDEAIVHLSEALKQKPELAEAHNNLGNAFRETGRIDEAVRHYREALRLKPGYAGALSNFAGILKTQGKIAEAIENYRAAISLRPDFIDAHNNLIMLLGYSAEVPHEELVNQTLKFNGSGVAHSSMFPIPAAGCESDTCPAIFAITRSIITSSRCCNITSTAISNSSPTPT